MNSFVDKDDFEMTWDDFAVVAVFSSWTSTTDYGWILGLALEVLQDVGRLEELLE